MRVVVVGSESSFHELERKYQGVYLEHKKAGADLDQCIRTAGVYAVLVMGPDIRAGDASGLGVLAQFRNLPVVICDDVTPAVAMVVVAVQKGGNPSLAIRRTNAVDKLTDFVCTHSPAREQLAYHAGIAHAIAKLPPRCRVALDVALALLPSPGAVVSSLASATGCSDAQLNVIMKAAGFANAHCVVQGARLINVWGFLQDTGFRRIDVARKCGYADAESVLRAVRALGIHSVAGFAALSGAEAVATVLGWVIR